MELDEFKKYTKNLDAYTAAEVEELIPMTSNELEAYQYELEYDGGNLSNWDNVRALITLKKQLIEQQEEIIELEETRDYLNSVIEVNTR